MYGIEVRTKEKQYKELTAEYEQYKRLNDLNRYFTMNLDDDSRERVLENVQKLMKVTDWHYIDKAVVDRMESSNPAAFLTQVITENENLQRKKAAELA